MAGFTKDAIEDILEVYKTLPALWKVKSKEYRDRSKKNSQYSILLDTFKKYDPNSTVKWGQ